MLSKRLFDFFLSLCGLVITSVVIIPIVILVWRQDKHSPFYIPERVGQGGKLFNMIKIRSMIVNADKSGVDSTSNKDPRITSLGNFIRKYKLDEITELWNVLKGDMSFVGPRPNVKRETDLYTNEEKTLLTMKPGITDLASIVFADEGEILEYSQDPDIDYNQLIRPWKSRLGIFYVEHASLWLDIQLIYLTLVALVSRTKALRKIQALLKKLGADEALQTVASRSQPLKPTPPPGAIEIVTARVV